MPAYLVNIVQLHDREKFKAYAQAASAVAARFGARYLLRAPGAKLLEGDFGAGAFVVIEEWPDRETVETYRASAEFAELKTLREGLADVNCLLVEAPGFGL